jgi:glutathione S-transferase
LELKLSPGRPFQFALEFPWTARRAMDRLSRPCCQQKPEVWALTTLYEFPPTRSQRAKWALEELGIAYTSQLVNLMEGQQNSEAYRAIHPLGVVPALETDDYTIFESVAIVLQLIDEHPEKNLAPAAGTPERAHYYQWSVFACAELDPAIMMVFDNTMRPLAHMRPPGAQHDAELAERGRQDFAARAEILSDALGGNDYILGSGFSGADILVGHSCFMANFTGLLGDFPVLEAYYGRLQQRSGHRRAYGVAEDGDSEPPAVRKHRERLAEDSNR